MKNYRCLSSDNSNQSLKELIRLSGGFFCLARFQKYFCFLHVESSWRKIPKVQLTWACDVPSYKAIIISLRPKRSFWSSPSWMFDQQGQRTNECETGDWSRVIEHYRVQVYIFISGFSILAPTQLWDTLC